MIHSQTLSGSDTYSLLVALADHPGWQLYLSRLNEAAVANLNALRNPGPIDKISFLQGEINGMERAAQLLGDMIKEEEQAAEKRKQAELLKLRQQEIERSGTQYA